MPDNHTLAPDFTLPDLQGRLHSPVDYRGQVVVINFWSAECPWAARYDALLQTWQSEWGQRVAVLWVDANTNEPLELVHQSAGERGLGPVLLDTRQEAARLYQATTNPHVFVLDAAGILRYQGAMDDVTFRQRNPSRFYLKEAVDSLLSGQLPVVETTPPFGCTIVY